jgi:hypothetical protein
MRRFRPTVALALAFALAHAGAGAAGLPADCSSAKPPAQPVEVSIAGTRYAPKSVKLVRAGTMKSGDTAFDTWRLTLRSEDSVMAPLGLDVTVAVPKGQSVAGKVFRRVPSDSIAKQPSVSEGLPEVQGWSYEDRQAGVRGSHVKYVASLRLEFGKAQGKTLPGTIVLCVPKGQKSSFDKTPTTADSTALGKFEALVQ